MATDFTAEDFDKAYGWIKAVTATTENAARFADIIDDDELTGPGIVVLECLRDAVALVSIYAEKLDSARMPPGLTVAGIRSRQRDRAFPEGPPLER
jgi:hypothetical protein